MAIAKHLSGTEAARLLAQVSFAAADAAIAASDTKFTFRQWRPITGIHEAEADGNPATTADPHWTPLLATPPYPDYVCGHSTLAGAVEAVLESHFGRRPGITMTMTSAAAPGVTHRYTTFQAISDEVIDAQVWAGVHWRTSCTTGRTVGRKVGRFVTTQTLWRVQSCRWYDLLRYRAERPLRPRQIRCGRSVPDSGCGTPIRDPSGIADTTGGGRGLAA